MSKKLLTSIVMISGITGAVSAETFPDDGYMLADAVYDNAAIYANMGVYEGTAYALAEYEDALVVPAGKYLPRGSDTPQTCPADSFCPGIPEAAPSDTSDQGINSCSLVADGVYPNSATGATNNTGCFKQCTVADVLHSTSVSGIDYYDGDEADVVVTCAATECANGYTLNTGTEEAPLEYAKCDANTIAISWGGTTEENTIETESYYCTYDGDLRAPSVVTSVPTGRTFLGWKVAGTSTVLIQAGQTIPNGCTYGLLQTYAAGVEMVPVYEGGNSGSSDPQEPLESQIYCAPGNYLPANATECEVCLSDHYCSGNVYDLDNDSAQGITPCPTGLVSAPGSKNAGYCGIMLHMDDDVMYLTSVKQTSPALAVRIDGDIYYGRISGGVKAMNEDTSHQLRVRIDGQEYSIHDNTIE